MKTTASLLTALLLVVCAASPSLAWRSANAWGGRSAGAFGAWGHVNRYGGATVHTWAGTAHVNRYGGATYGRVGAGVVHTYPGGVSVYHPPGYSPVVPYPVYPAFHPPVAIPYYSTGCGGCAVAAGAIAGATLATATAAAVADANVDSNAAAYSAGYGAGAASARAYAMGGSYARLPSGCIMPTVGGKTYYLCGDTWFKPVYGANGVYYVVVPKP